MRSLFQASLGAAVMLALVLRWSTADAQPAPKAPSLTSASQQAKAKKLTDDAIAAESAKNYATAITLYQQAYQLVPHPILQFNIGQVYMFSGDRAEAEKYFRRYLARDPNGPGAPVAREFLASLPATTSNPPQTRSASRPTHRTSSGKQTATTTSDVASAPDHKPLSAGTMRATDKDPGMRHPKQSEVTTSASDLDEDELLKPSGVSPIDVTQSRDGHLDEDELRSTPGVTYAKEQRKHATETLYISYAVMGAGTALGVTALAAVSERDARIGLGIMALVFTGGGVGAFLHGRSQLRAAKAVAWSPVVGSGFAGVALGGTLP